jgi:hypothetical protein
MHQNLSFVPLDYDMSSTDVGPNQVRFRRPLDEMGLQRFMDDVSESTGTSYDLFVVKVISGPSSKKETWSYRIDGNFKKYGGTVAKFYTNSNGPVFSELYSSPADIADKECYDKIMEAARKLAPKYPTKRALRSRP